MLVARLGRAPVLMIALASLALGFVALYARFMAWSEPRQAGVDFTIAQCADAGLSMFLGVIGGQIAERFGYPALFAIALTIGLACALGMIRFHERWICGAAS